MPLKSLLQAFNPKPKSRSALRTAVIGAGRMGTYHARHLARLSELRFIVDADADSARRLAQACHTEARASFHDIFKEIDAAIVATPTPTHYQVGKELLSAGISCLIGKPLAATPEQAEELIRVAEEHQAILQVGHIERFNPAILEAIRFIDHPQFIEVNRLGPFDPRVAHIGVVMDLMIHDLDIVLFLVNSRVTRLEAFGAKVLSDHEDIAKVRLQFENGCVADLSASRISMERYRRIRVFQRDTYLSIDYASPKIKVYRKKSPVVKSLADIELLRPKLTKKDPLQMELSHFLACIEDHKTPLITGTHGRDALQLASDVLTNLHIAT